MKILIKNSTLISMSENREQIEENIDILIDGNRISKVDYNLNDENIDKVIDATGKIVMPGLINTHSHIPMSIFRETVDGLCMQDWLEKKIWPMEDKLTDEDVYYASMLSYLEMIETGCTTINDMYYMTENSIKAAVNTGVRLQTTRTLTELEENVDGSKRIIELKELLKKYRNKNDNITFNVGIHGLYTANRNYIKECVNIAKEEKLPIQMHFCENSKEVEDIEKIYNEKPVQILEKEFQNIKLLLAHCVKLSDEEINRMAKIGNISIAHCPVSNLKLGCGVANISEMMKQGINVALGTDGQGSGCNLDMFEEMKYAVLLQKGIKEEAKLLPAYEVLKMATINGAKALNLEDEIGTIEVGKKADLIVIDLSNVITNPINNIFAELVYNVKGYNVETTIINGNILMDDRKLLIDKKEIIDKCKEIIDRIK